MRIAVIFTLGVSLDSWEQLGVLTREREYYAKLCEKSGASQIFWFTYGNRDSRFDGRLPSFIRVIPKPRLFAGKIGNLIYSFLMPLLFPGIFLSLSLVKTNQMRGAWAAVIAARLYRKPLVARTGYSWSTFVSHHPRKTALDHLATAVEWTVYRFADAAIVTSRTDAEYIQVRYRIPCAKVNVIGNFVDTDLFRPQEDARRYPDRLVFVGRLSPQKNLANLIKAVAQLPCSLDIYSGSGELREELEGLAQRLQARVSFKGSVDNDLLCGILNNYEIFVLPSLYEGAPKALLEAMSCGLAVIGTDVCGTNEIISHNRNGWLVKKTDSESLKEGIGELLRRPELRKSLGLEARRYVTENLSLQALAQKEADLCRRLIRHYG